MGKTDSHPSFAGVRARHASREDLHAALADSRARLFGLIDDLTDAQFHVPYRAGINRLLWEIGHVAHFAELWTLRGPHHAGTDGFIYAARPPLTIGPDDIYDSARLAHADRWRAALPDRHEMTALLHRSLERVQGALAEVNDDDDGLYFHRLSLFHEDMHCEAFAWLRAALAYPAPAGVTLPCVRQRDPVRCAGGVVRLGSNAKNGFAFDNELQGASVTLSPFEIDATCVTAGAFVRFVEAGGYDDPAHWTQAGAAWRQSIYRSYPERWRRVGTDWQVRWYDRWMPLDPDQPVIHVSAYEAEAYAHWCGRRLPSAAEWERAAVAGLIDWGGTVWEWTADAFLPYPGFERGPYRDYSAPWFETHREMRGGAYVTHPRMHHPRYRNFFMPHRTDVFGGLRTARSI